MKMDSSITQTQEGNLEDLLLEEDQEMLMSIRKNKFGDKKD